MSVGRERLIVNCGAFPAGPAEWRDATRATAAHSTLVIADISSSEIKPIALGRRPYVVEVQRQEAGQRQAGYAMDHEGPVARVAARARHGAPSTATTASTTRFVESTDTIDPVSSPNLFDARPL